MSGTHREVSLQLTNKSTLKKGSKKLSLSVIKTLFLWIDFKKWWKLLSKKFKLP